MTETDAQNDARDLDMAVWLICDDDSAVQRVVTRLRHYGYGNPTAYQLPDSIKEAMNSGDGSYHP